jgi:hypothetical protein
MYLSERDVRTTGHDSNPRSDRERFILTRAMVFTREAYRSLRIAPSHPPAPAKGIGPAPLTPWDLMDEEESDAGIAFTLFQRRSERAALRRSA